MNRALLACRGYDDSVLVLNAGWLPSRTPSHDFDFISKCRISEPGTVRPPAILSCSSGRPETDSARISNAKLSSR